jgi:hypothetical protein
LTTPRSYVTLVLYSIASAPKLTEVSFIFTWMTLDEDLDVVTDLLGWGQVDEQLCRLAKQSAEELTVSFDFLTEPGWAPRKGAAGMRFMQRFRRYGVMKLKSFGDDVATYYPRA